jgi:N-carbamoyl-L-amino-acid hydrolase
MNAQRVIADLRELAALTSTADGAQRLAWGPVWREAREWFRTKITPLGLDVRTDSAGNNFVTLPGVSSKTVIVGSHLDSVPNGGWLDGCPGVMAALEHARMHAARNRRSPCGSWTGPTKRARVSDAAFSGRRPRPAA